MGGHHHQEFKVPDWRSYKVENAPQLMELQKVLATKGLKDPWIRNEVWRFNPKEFGTHSQLFRMFFFRGFLLGLGALGVTIAVEKAWEQISPPKHGHGHGHDH